MEKFVIVKYLRTCFRINVVVCGSIFLLCLPGPSKAETLDARISRLWQAYQATPADSAAQAVRILAGLSHDYRLLGMSQASDSVADMLFRRAKRSGDNALLIGSMNHWFSSRIMFDGIPSAFKDSQRVAGYLRAMMGIARQEGNNLWLSQAWHSRAIFELSNRKLDNAGAAAGKAYYHASLSTDNRQKLFALLLLGSCEKNLNHKLEAFSHYMDALSLARLIDEPPLLSQVYERLFLFFYTVNNYDKAEEYLNKIFPLVSIENPADSGQLMYHYVNLSLLQCAQHDYDDGMATAKRVLDYCRQVHNHYYRTDLLRVLRSILIEQGEYKRLSDLYRAYYPEEWQRVAREDPFVYYQLQAAFAEAAGQFDSSKYYYRQAAASLAREGRPPGTKAFFYRRYGQALLRFGEHRQALPLLDTALRYSEQVQYLPYMAELSNSLDSMYAQRREPDKAYAYAKLSQRYTAALTQANRQDEILMMDLENELRGRELLARQAEARTQHRHNIQYTAMILLIGFCFLILILLGSFRVPRWVITGMGFFSFIFFFEFIILLIDHRLHELTHGEPWKILSIKIIIIAILLPLHHWMEHRVVHYLQVHSLAKSGRFSLPALMNKMRISTIRMSPNRETSAAADPEKET